MNYWPERCLSEVLLDIFAPFLLPEGGSSKGFGQRFFRAANPKIS